MAGGVTKKKLDIFIAAVKSGDSISSACKKCGVSRTHMYAMRDPEHPNFKGEAFVQEWDDAIFESLAIYEDELKERVLVGEPILDRNGNVIGHKKSDRLLELKLQHLDDTYIPRRKTELTGADGGPLQTENATSIVLDPEARKQRIRELRETLGKREE